MRGLRHIGMSPLARTVGVSACGFLVFAWVAATDAAGAEMRGMRTISSPNLPDARVTTATPGSAPRDLTGIPATPPRGEIEAVVRDIVKKWNTPAFSGVLADDFRGAAQLLDSLSLVDNTARLELVRINSIQPIRRRVEELTGPGDPVVVRDRVAVEITTRVTYASSSSGVKSSEGTNELIVDIEQRYVR